MLLVDAGKLDAASQRRAKLLEDHKAVKTQLQALDTPNTAGPTAPAAAAKDGPLADDVPFHKLHPRKSVVKAGAGSADEASDRSDRDNSGGEDDPVAAEARKAKKAERQKQQRELHKRRKDICAQLDQTKVAVCLYPHDVASLASA